MLTDEIKMLRHKLSQLKIELNAYTTDSVKELFKIPSVDEKKTLAYCRLRNTYVTTNIDLMRLFGRAAENAYKSDAEGSVSEDNPWHNQAATAETDAKAHFTIRNSMSQTYLWHLEEAACLGLANAQTELGTNYRRYGRKEPKTHEMMLIWYHRAAALGSAEAENLLGELHEHGEGVEKSEGQAALWYRRAAEQDVLVENDKHGGIENLERLGSKTKANPVTIYHWNAFLYNCRRISNSALLDLFKKEEYDFAWLICDERMPNDRKNSLYQSIQDDCELRNKFGYSLMKMAEKLEPDNFQGKVDYYALVPAKSESWVSALQMMIEIIYFNTLYSAELHDALSAFSAVCELYDKLYPNAIGDAVNPHYICFLERRELALKEGHKKIFMPVLSQLKSSMLLFSHCEESNHSEVHVTDHQAHCNRSRP